MKLLTVPPLVLALLAPATVEFPWKTFAEMSPHVVSVGIGMCPNGEEVFKNSLVKDNVTWAYWVGDSRLVVAMWRVGNEDTPDAIGFGILDSANPETVPPLRWESFDPTIHRSPCDSLFPTTVQDEKK